MTAHCDPRFRSHLGRCVSAINRDTLPPETHDSHLKHTHHEVVVPPGRIRAVTADTSDAAPILDQQLRQEQRGDVGTARTRLGCEALGTISPRHRRDEPRWRRLNEGAGEERAGEGTRGLSHHSLKTFSLARGPPQAGHCFLLHVERSHPRRSTVIRHRAGTCIVAPNSRKRPYPRRVNRGRTSPPKSERGEKKSHGHHGQQRGARPADGTRSEGKDPPATAARGALTAPRSSSPPLPPPP